MGVVLRHGKGVMKREEKGGSGIWVQLYGVVRSLRMKDETE